MERDNSTQPSDREQLDISRLQRFSFCALGSSVLIRGVPAQLVGDNTMLRDENRLGRIVSGRPDVLAHGRPVAQSVGSKIPRISQ